MKDITAVGIKTPIPCESYQNNVLMYIGNNQFHNVSTPSFLDLLHVWAVILRSYLAILTEKYKILNDNTQRLLLWIYQESVNQSWCALKCLFIVDYCTRLLGIFKGKRFVGALGTQYHLLRDDPNLDRCSIVNSKGDHILPVSGSVIRLHGRFYLYDQGSIFVAGKAMFVFIDFHIINEEGAIQSYMRKRYDEVLDSSIRTFLDLLVSWYHFHPRQVGHRKHSIVHARRERAGQFSVGFNKCPVFVLAYFLDLAFSWFILWNDWSCFQLIETGVSMQMMDLNYLISHYMQVATPVPVTTGLVDQGMCHLQIPLLRSVKVCFP